MTEAPLSRVEAVGVTFGATVALRDVTIELHRGLVTALVGPNGSGKTTLLKVLLGLRKPDSGRVLFSGGERPREGYVPQADRSEPMFPVKAMDVLLMGLTPELGPWRRPRTPA